MWIKRVRTWACSALPPLSSSLPENRVKLRWPASFGQTALGLRPDGLVKGGDAFPGSHHAHAHARACKADNSKNPSPPFTLHQPSLITAAARPAVRFGGVKFYLNA